MNQHAPIPGRGTSVNPANRFERILVAPDADHPAEEGPDPRTEFYWDESRTIISENKSPDLPFVYSLNPYRGCEHGCSYCYARPYHEYLGLSAGLDFESKIFVKRDAARLLRAELMKPSWQPSWISLSGVTDPYQPCEARFKVTRSILEVMAEFRHPCSVITKNSLITRDLDLLQQLAEHDCVGTVLSITTLDEDLLRRLEPRTATARRRLEAVRELADAGIPVGVNVAPVIPGLNDEEIPAILSAAKAAGASWAGMTVVRLPMAAGDIFEAWVHQHFPDRAAKVMRRIRELRGGRLNNAGFHDRMRGNGQRAEQIEQLFNLARRKAGFSDQRRELNAQAFRRPGETRRMFETG
ncbi:MAG: PA0069 family radical SAM protein [Planctomycetes bacterium]|nr:PA0069 family radical SAM protein [Planctomycetota bacterium]